MNMKGVEKVNNGYEETQKEIDKLLWETSQQRTNKKYQNMQTDKDFQERMKKISKLVLKLKRIEK